MPDTPRPTDAELEILTVLWSRGPSTVRDVHETIQKRRPAQYTTVLKMLQIMAEKGLVVRDEASARTFMKPPTLANGRSGNWPAICSGARSTARRAV